MPNTYMMKISRLTVDKLGVKLYDRVSAVIAELVANSYDADATEVTIMAPMGQFLASKTASGTEDKGLSIEITDNGIGMTPSEVNAFYLRVGAERRADPQRGDTSQKYGRKVMGRKGVGKLAPFGVCRRIELISSGGSKITGTDAAGNTVEGYLTAHLILDKADILMDSDADYPPVPGQYDDTVMPKTGTTLKLTFFDHRRVPTIDQFERQLAQRFGLASSNWKVLLVDSLKTPADSDYSREVGQFQVSTMPDTTIKFETVGSKVSVPPKRNEFRVTSSDGTLITDFSAGFDCNGSFYPLTGWIAYAQQPYKDDLMAGVRIYCRGKIAAQSSVFNLKAGFTGEYDIRSYLVGELHADWLDEEEDLIRTDRQDILWSHDLGQAFEQWGQVVLKKIGAITREPRRKKAWDVFQEVAKIEEVTNAAFPSDDQDGIRKNTIEIAKSISRTAREDELRDPAQVEALVQLCLLLGPHITLDRSLRQAADDKDSPLVAITSILKTARIAELSSFGHIADDRVKVIQRVEVLKDDPATLEDAFQELITQAPWLVNPQWAPITANQAFSTLKAEFAKYYKLQTGNDIALDDFALPRKRADFVMTNQDNAIEIIEIKKPSHALTNEEMKRIDTYASIMERFLTEPGHTHFCKLFPSFHITLVCDSLALDGIWLRGFNGLKAERKLEHIPWRVFLLRTRLMHEEFLKEAERQKHIAIGGTP